MEALGQWVPCGSRAGCLALPLAHLPALCLAEDPTFRCEDCDELFQCKLDLRRHKKYACSSAGAPLYEGLGEDLKPEGLGGGGDGQAHECKDCERMFPNKYRCRPALPRLPLPPAGGPLVSSPPPCQSWTLGLGDLASYLLPHCTGNRVGARGWIEAAGIFSP